MKTISLFTISAIVFLFLSARAQAADGKTLYQANCIKCHGDDGRGVTKLGKKLQVRDFTDPEVWNTFDDEDSFKAVKNGIKKDGELIMGYKLPDEEIKAMIDYMKTLVKPPSPSPATTNTASARP